jgi:hypothetical protein
MKLGEILKKERLTQTGKKDESKVKKREGKSRGK